MRSFLRLPSNRRPVGYPILSLCSNVLNIKLGFKPLLPKRGIWQARRRKKQPSLAALKLNLLTDTVCILYKAELIEQFETPLAIKVGSIMDPKHLKVNGDGFSEKERRSALLN